MFTGSDMYDTVDMCVSSIIYVSSSQTSSVKIQLRRSALII